MKEYESKWYIADKGKHFVLTEKGKCECASYKDKTVGEPVDEDDTAVIYWAVKNGYVTETDIPNWIVKTGYEVLYDHKGHTLHAGSPIVFPERIFAENYMNHHKQFHPHDELYIHETVYEGREPKECRKFKNKQVYNIDWYFGLASLKLGDYVEEEIVSGLLDCTWPVCMRTDCSQLGEPANHKVDKDGNCRATYETFKQVSKGIWEYCGACFKGENVAA